MYADAGNDSSQNSDKTSLNQPDGTAPGYVLVNGQMQVLEKTSAMTSATNTPHTAGSNNESQHKQKDSETQTNISDQGAVSIGAVNSPRQCAWKQVIQIYERIKSKTFATGEANTTQQDSCAELNRKRGHIEDILTLFRGSFVRASKVGYLIR